MAVSLGNWLGVNVLAHWTLIFLLILLTISFQDTFRRIANEDYATGFYWLAGILASIGLLICVLLHELAHSLVAIKYFGVDISSITLFIFGGVSAFTGDAVSPKQEFFVAIAGPLCSAALGGIFEGIGMAVRPKEELTGIAIWWLGTVNIILAVFNAIPAFPLDGGRILRAIIWATCCDKLNATYTAALVGKLFGWCLIFSGFVTLFYEVLSGVWLILLGWLLISAAAGEEHGVIMSESLRRVTVGNVMSTPVIMAPSHITVEDFVYNYVLNYRHSCFPVVGPTGQLLGLACLGRVRNIDPQYHRSLNISHVTAPMELVPVAYASESLEIALTKLAAAHDKRMLVLNRERNVVGIISYEDVLRSLQIQSFVMPPRDLEQPRGELTVPLLSVPAPPSLSGYQYESTSGYSTSSSGSMMSATSPSKSALKVVTDTNSSRSSQARDNDAMTRDTQDVSIQVKSPTGMP